MGEAAQRGRVTMILRRRVHDPNAANMQPMHHHQHPQHQQHPQHSQHPQHPQHQQHQQHQHPQHIQHPHMQREFIYPYDVIVSRNENESFGFVIISASNQYYGSTIGMYRYLIIKFNAND